MTDYRRLLVECDAEGLARQVEQTTGIAVPPLQYLGRCLAVCARNRITPDRLGMVPGHEWSDASWRCWLKVRAMEFLPSHQPRIRWTVVGSLHVGLVAVEETAEQVERLRQIPSGEAEPPEETTARSRISSTQHYLTPIDAVAAKVAWVRLKREREVVR